MCTATLTRTKTVIKAPSMWTVVFYNDDKTPMDLVVAILVEIFLKKPEEAFVIMMTIHTEGKCPVGIYTKEIADTKVVQVDTVTHKLGYPLKVKAERI